MCPLKHCPGMTDPIESYLAACRDRRYSPATVAGYRKCLMRLTGFLTDLGIERVQDVTEAYLHAYREHLAQSNIAGSTLDNYLRSARRLFIYLAKNDHVFLNPAADLQFSRPHVRILPVPTEKDIRTLLNQPDTSIPVGIRDRAILETAYTSGIRHRELSGLLLSDLDLGNAVLRIRGKGNKERMVPLGKSATGWLKQYLITRSALIKAEGEPALWVSRYTGKQLSYNRIRHLVHDYGKAAGIKCSISIHAIRRACASHMLRNGAHPVQIQHLLGHADLKNLGRYLNVTITELKKTHERSRPGQ